MEEYDLVVVGAGPGGYVSAIRGAQLGMKTAIVEKDAIGGICLNWGCIPSKALLRNAEVLSLFKRAETFGISYSNLSYDFAHGVDRSRQVVRRLTKGVEGLLRKNKIRHISGVAVLKNRNIVEVASSGELLNTKNIIVATGAQARSIPALPIDGDFVITSREALELREVPSPVIIVGAGATGAEFAYLFNAYGADVTLVELLPRIVPNEDVDISQHLESALSKQGIRVLTNTKVEGFSRKDNIGKAKLSAPDGESEVDCAKILVSIGINGNIENLGLENAGVETDRGFIVINDRMQTTTPGIYAIGDVTGKLALAHVASAQGITAVESIAGMETPILNYFSMPRATYCQPQIGSIGLTEEQALLQGRKVKLGKFPFGAIGKAIAMEDTEGLVKLVVDTELGEILGAHMIGPEVTEFLGELSLLQLLEGTTNELGWLVHPHPTLSEVLKEAALAADGKAIHI